jgi:hypothetical protein
MHSVTSYSYTGKPLPGRGNSERHVTPPWVGREGNLFRLFGDLQMGEGVGV